MTFIPCNEPIVRSATIVRLRVIPVSTATDITSICDRGTRLSYRCLGLSQVTCSFQCNLNETTRPTKGLASAFLVRHANDRDTDFSSLCFLPTASLKGMSLGTKTSRTVPSLNGQMVQDIKPFNKKVTAALQSSRAPASKRTLSQRFIRTRARISPTRRSYRTTSS